MKRAARGFRFLGRTLLAAGAVIVAGAITVMSYLLFGGWEESSVAPAPGIVPGGPSVDVSVRTSSLIWSTLIIIFALVGLMFIFGRLNAFMRKTIKKVADFINASIFATEVAAAGLVWILASIILLFVLPVGAILTGTLLILNELCFVFAWLGYGREKYSL